MQKEALRIEISMEVVPFCYTVFLAIDTGYLRPDLSVVVIFSFVFHAGCSCLVYATPLNWNSWHRRCACFRMRWCFVGSSMALNGFQQLLALAQSMQSLSGGTFTFFLFKNPDGSLCWFGFFVSSCEAVGSVVSFDGSQVNIAGSIGCGCDGVATISTDFMLFLH